MLRDRYTFKMGYNEWGLFCAHCKDRVSNTPPRARKFAEQAALLNISVLKEFQLRLDRKLCTYKSTVSFTLKQSEALAIYLIYKSGGFPPSLTVRTIVETIDKQI